MNRKKLVKLKACQIFLHLLILRTGKVYRISMMNL
ncbi:hypothetical protein O163_11795 [Caldanaerobacter subterraneus subsp. yonseiensis KB-1]|uniref:Uncharacterized protein n=1 Tax=Caldanaerobacter subterraneus subsp. yonseiensis KB-1 TaxID=1388761 RepID=U5CN17_CALSX|nr:hypothetical protein O163_11795 [Caldanaerobacter subterraneus subsp. yonseiensis KB-1]